MTGHQLRMTYFAGKQDLYALAIDIRMRLYERTHSQADMEAALAASEHARARNLLDLLTEARADLNKGVSTQDAEKGRRLAQEINTLTQSLLRLRSAKRTEDAAGVETRLGTLITEYDDLQAKNRSANKAYAGLREPRPLGAREIQEQLEGDTLLLEYALGEDRSYLWAVTRTGITCHFLPGRAEIEAATDRLRKTITAYEPPLQGETNLQYLARLKKAEVDYGRQSLDLSRAILEPVYSQLGNKQLIIVADGALQYIPFEALPRPVASGRTQSASAAAGYAPLLTQNDVVYQPSASALALLRTASRSKATKTVAVLADPVFDSKDDRMPALARGASAVTGQRQGELGRALRDVGDIGVSDADFKLERLRYSSAEADYITAAAAPGSWEKATGFKASRATVLGTDLAQFKIVHFATHAILNSKNPELSGIVLSLVNERGQPEDGFLGLRDIYNLNLPVDLVVLSACRTGIGKKVRGEGLMGLTRGFMYAGAPRVVASLWKVDDEATAELMKRFYRNMLKRKMTAAAALRQARVELMEAREQWRAPFYWAGFVLQGDWK
jgi:CHAT domain-containing protein